MRDASGRQPGRTRDPRPSLQSLRLDLPLAAGYLVTVEPGIYFIPALLNDAARRSRFAHQVRWELVDQHLALGGVRIEDNVLITPRRTRRADQRNSEVGIVPWSVGPSRFDQLRTLV